MGARTTNAPAYAVIDRSFVQNVSVAPAQANTSNTITGSVASIIDNAWTNAYTLRNTSITLFQQPNTDASITIDYGNTFSNCQIGFRVTTNGNSPNNPHAYVQTSLDGSNWTNQTIDIWNTTTEASLTVTRLRYIRFYCVDEGGTGQTGWVQTALYQCRLMGSN